MKIAANTAARTEHAAGSPGTEAGAGIGATTALQQHECNDRQRGEHLDDGQRRKQHVSVSVPRRSVRASTAGRRDDRDEVLGL
jgi:hypothetical protein